MKATLSRDGQYRITMKVAFRLDLGLLANVLASCYSGHSLEMDGPLPKLAQKAVKDAIREQIENRGLNVDGWSDQFDTAETNDRFAWANEQVARAYPELAEAAPATEVAETPATPAAPIAKAETAMTYKEALAEARKVGVSKCSDPALMAQFLDANAQLLIGAVSPELMWDGAQKTGLTTKALLAAIHKDPIEAAELMWV